MGETTISWCDKVWNVTRGCRRVSPGCENCYAERQANRFAGPGGAYDGLIRVYKRTNPERSEPRWSGDTTFAVDRLADPLRWKKPCRVFVDSMSDLFYEGFSNEQIAAVFGVMAACPQHTFQVLTKRAERMREWFDWFESEWADEMVPDDQSNEALRRTLAGMAQSDLGDGSSEDEDRQFWRIHDATEHAEWPLANVWLGVSVEDQERADERIPELLRTPAAVRWISAEPLLGPLDVRRWLPPAQPALDWIVTGCES